MTNIPAEPIGGIPAPFLVEAVTDDGTDPAFGALCHEATRDTLARSKPLDLP
jgi:hypothetical protein